MFRFGSPLISSLPLLLFFSPFIWLNIKNIPFFECNLLLSTTAQHKHLDLSLPEQSPALLYLCYFTWALGSPSHGFQTRGHQSCIPLAYQTRPDQSHTWRLWHQWQQWQQWSPPNALTLPISHLFELYILRPKNCINFCSFELLRGSGIRNFFAQVCRHIGIAFRSWCRSANINTININNINNIALFWLQWQTRWHTLANCPTTSSATASDRVSVQVFTIRISMLTHLYAFIQVMQSDGRFVRTALRPIISNTSFTNCLTLRAWVRPRISLRESNFAFS